MSAGWVDAWILPALMEAPHALRRHGDGDREVRPLADVGAEDVGGAGLVGDVLDDARGRPREPVRRLPAERDDQPRHRRHAPGEPASHDQRRRQRRRAAESAPLPGAGRSKGNRATSAAAAASPISTRSAPAVPRAGSKSRLNDRAPAMAPIVLAA